MLTIESIDFGGFEFCDEKRWFTWEHNSKRGFIKIGKIERIDWREVVDWVKYDIKESDWGDVK